MGDLGGYGIAELPPTGPLWEVVRNSISTHVTHAEITHFTLQSL